MQVERHQRRRVADRPRVAPEGTEERSPERAARALGQAELADQPEESLHLLAPLLEARLEAALRRVQPPPDLLDPAEVARRRVDGFDHLEVVLQDLRPRPAGDEVE